MTAPALAPLGPVDADDGLHALDILRGLALLGMILVHFHQHMRLPAAGVEDLIGWGVWVLVERKPWGHSPSCSGSGLPFSCAGSTPGGHRWFRFTFAGSRRSRLSA